MLEMNVTVRAPSVHSHNFGRIDVFNLDLELASLHVGAVVGYGSTYVNGPTNCHEYARIRRVICRVDARRTAGAHAGRREDIKPGVLEGAGGWFASILEFAKRGAKRMLLVDWLNWPVVLARVSVSTDDAGYEQKNTT